MKTTLHSSDSRQETNPAEFRFVDFEVPDVRALPDFDPAAYPKADGTDLDDIDDLDRDPQRLRKRTFLSIYYRLNKLYAGLAEARDAGDTELADRILGEATAASELRANVEKHYAPIGFAAEPQLDGLITTNVVFSFSRLGPQPEPLPRRAFVRIDLPDDIHGMIQLEDSSPRPNA